ncbi:GNAT family N-acetyltransferase [Mesobacillus maritimus]|uniref:GNAT family N-acetyltransferase n=1 Tax=Mesobacillus maritimus TaxID=1643336 RepID=A0ABS7K1B2_9BACI|nr:GNAT family N-acetyltransferase [Mesobacillus maritimus]MBY0095941.1 GNAT family N-acetyltransferase [Mesobacillus maritimus]
MNKPVFEEIEIRNLQTVVELERVRQLEAIVWSFEDSVPVNQTITVVKNGGFILGAFLHNELIGFQYSFPGFDGKQVYLCSHSLGIHPEYRKYGVGEKLKWAQKGLAEAMGYELISWTYDPLETVNGNLNLHKLGAICTSYLEDAYGEMGDGLNSGIATDRFLVEWRVDEIQDKKGATKFEQRDKQVDLQNFVMETTEKDGFLIPGEINFGLDSDLLFVPVPGNFQEIKSADFSLAVEWRNITRKIFTHYLPIGWQVTDLIKKDQNHYLYVLEKRG